MDFNVLECGDGHTCNVRRDPQRWNCCKGHKGRAKCPKNYPTMCNEKLCVGKTDYCCSKKDLNCGWWNKGRSNGMYFGGIRPCGNFEFTCKKYI